MRLRLLCGLALLASLSFAGVRSYPPASGGVAGGSGPRADEQLVGTVQGTISDGGFSPVPSAEFIICPSGLTGVADGGGNYQKLNVPVGSITVKAVDPGHTLHGSNTGVVTDGGTTFLDVTINAAYTPLVCP